MDVTYVTGAQGVLRPEEAREREAGSSSNTFDLLLNLPSSVGVVERAATEDRQQDRSREDQLAEREAASREVLDRRARKRDSERTKRAQATQSAAERSRERRDQLKEQEEIRGGERIDMVASRNDVRCNC